MLNIKRSRIQDSSSLETGFQSRFQPSLILNPRLRSTFLLCVLALAFLSAACRQDMHDQPKYKPLQPSAFFPDSRSARQPVEGTVARDQLRDDAQLYTGKLGTGQTTSPQPAPAVSTQAGQQSQTQTYQGYATTFPFSIDEAALDRGEERFNIYCSVCHSRTGEGGGPVVLRGYRKPPSLHEPRLQTAPPGYFFDVITNGFGAMPDYSTQISPEDRWKIIAYIRALQLSQRANIADVPVDQRDKIRNPNQQQGGKQGEPNQ